MGARRIFATVAVAGAIALGLTGCAPPITDSDAAETFGSMPGVVSTDVSCSQPLPFTYSCSTQVVVARDVLEGEIVDVMTKAREVRLPGSLTIQADSRTHDESDIRIDDAAQLGEVLSIARIFTAALTMDGVESLRIGFANNPDRDVLVDAQLPKANDEALFTVVSDLSAILPSAHLILWTERIKLSSTGEPLGAEQSLYTAVAGAFPVLGGAIQPGYVELQIDPSADLQAAKDFAAKQPEYGRISAVSLTNDDSVDVRDVDVANSASVLAITDAARELPEFRSATVRANLIDFAIDEVGDARSMDSSLRDLPEYDTASIRYSLPGFSITRAVGGEFFFDVWEALASDPVIASASIGQYTDDFGDFHVKIDGANNTDPYDLGVALGASGLPQMPATSIIIGVRGSAGLYSTSFTAGTTISLKTDKWLSRSQAAALQKGWADGQR